LGRITHAFDVNRRIWIDLSRTVYRFTLRRLDSTRAVRPAPANRIVALRAPLNVELIVILAHH
jgi:hypothetical protein